MKNKQRELPTKEELRAAFAAAKCDKKSRGWIDAFLNENAEDVEAARARKMSFTGISGIFKSAGAEISASKIARWWKVGKAAREPARKAKAAAAPAAPEPAADASVKEATGASPANQATLWEEDDGDRKTA